MKDWRRWTHLQFGDITRTRVQELQVEDVREHPQDAVGLINGLRVDRYRRSLRAINERREVR